jgi:monothiol glutaredoxin
MVTLLFFYIIRCCGASLLITCASLPGNCTPEVFGDYFVYRLLKMMIRRFVVGAVRRPIVPAGRVASRGFSADADDGSHNDFKPKKKTIPSEMQEVIDLIDKQIKENDVMLYMKGTPARPQCGFSAKVVRVLNATGVSFSSVNILEYGAIREGVKLYSDWPTLPQLYVKGEFVGGCDIVSDMYEAGELETLFKEKRLLE